MRALATFLFASAFLLIGFAAGRATAPQFRVTVTRSSLPGWIEVRRDGEVVSEWQPSDGEVYRSLDEALRPPVHSPAVAPGGECPLS